jgi:hypothetical protein
LVDDGQSGIGKFHLQLTFGMSMDQDVPAADFSVHYVVIVLHRQIKDNDKD